MSSCTTTTYEVWSWDLERALMGFATCEDAEADTFTHSTVDPETGDVLDTAQYVKLASGWWAVMRKPFGPITGMRLVPHRFHDRERADEIAEAVGGYVEVKRG